MKMTMHRDMIEATRLTRQGRLNEAMALIQNMLQSGIEPDAKTGGSSPHGASQVIELAPQLLKAPEIRRSPSKGRVDAGPVDVLPDKSSDRAPPPKPGRLGRLMARFGERRAIAPGSGTQPGLSAPDVPGVLASGGQFLSATFTDHAGKRDYKLYIPSGHQGRPLPLVVMLHGCTQSADDFAAGTRMNLLAEDRGFFVAYPVQPASANGSRCWNWFNNGHQQRDRGEPALIAGITRQISTEYAIDPQRIYVAGLSAGGAAAAIMAATYSDIYAAAGVHSGLACGAASDLSSALSAMRQGTSGGPKRSQLSSGLHGRDRFVPTIVFHGDRDATVHPQNGHHVIEQSRPAGLSALRSVTQHGHVPSGRTYSRNNHLDAQGRTLLEMWVVHGAGHAWSGGSREGTFTDPKGPDASREMIRFFLEHSHPAPAAKRN